MSSYESDALIQRYPTPSYSYYLQQQKSDNTTRCCSCCHFCCCCVGYCTAMVSFCCITILILVILVAYAFPRDVNVQYMQTKDESFTLNLLPTPLFELRMQQVYNATNFNNYDIQLSSFYLNVLYKNTSIGAITAPIATFAKQQTSVCDL